MHPRQDARVFLFHCAEYDVARIRALVGGAMASLDLRPSGRTLVKPNLVAAGELFQHAYTRPEIVEGVLGALRDREEAAAPMTELAVGERCGITIPTRYVYEEASYEGVFERTGAKKICFEEVPQVEVPLTHEGRLRDYVYTPETVARADFFVNCPKFKAHPWTTVTFSMKNYIGIQDDRHRMIDHDHALNRKVADLQYVIQPQLVVIDCIIAGEGRMLTPIPRTMNLLIIGNNQVAIDAIGCMIVGLDPLSVEHIRLAHERGFGPVSLDQIRLEGDVTLETAQERAKGFQVGLVKVDKYFEGTKIKAYAGKAPKGSTDDYCWGGCPGVMEEVIEVLRLYDAKCDEKLPNIHFVFGKYDGPVEVSYGEKVIFVGDCAEWEGTLGGQLVSIRSKYAERATLDPHEAKHKDVYGRMLRMTNKLRELKSRPFVRLEGCPVSIGELILLLAELGGVQNPYFDKRQIVGFNRSYMAWRGATALKRMLGKPYQVRGVTERGAARPTV
ncbi:MAG: Iron-sulfur cluster-binding protein [Labilithrix sp.]|nr:Iron-sulfur cluster-binding protein [Labilithrix sp.]